MLAVPAGIPIGCHAAAATQRLLGRRRREPLGLRRPALAASLLFGLGCCLVEGMPT
jgi:hypothetical protein